MIFKLRVACIFGRFLSDECIRMIAMDDSSSLGATRGTDQTCFTHPGLDRRTGQLAIYTRLVTPLRGVTHLSALCATSRGAMRQRNRLQREAVRPGTPAILLPVDRFSGWYCAFGRHDNRDLRPGMNKSEIGENAIAAY